MSLQFLYIDDDVLRDFLTASSAEVQRGDVPMPFGYSKDEPPVLYQRRLQEAGGVQEFWHANGGIVEIVRSLLPEEAGQIVSRRDANVVVVRFIHCKNDQGLWKYAVPLTKKITSNNWTKQWNGDFENFVPGTLMYREHVEKLKSPLERFYTGQQRKVYGL